jgi:hypothetical protein
LLFVLYKIYTALCFSKWQRSKTSASKENPGIFQRGSPQETLAFRHVAPCGAISARLMTKRQESVSEMETKMTRQLTKHVARRQDQTFADWFAELRELAGERWADVADQAPTVYAVWGGCAWLNFSRTCWPARGRIAPT